MNTNHHGGRWPPSSSQAATLLTELFGHDLVIYAAIVVGAAVLYQRVYAYEEEERIAEQLHLVAEPKIERIEEWLHEREVDLALLASRPDIIALVASDESGQGEVAKDISSWLDSACTELRLYEIRVIDSNGESLACSLCVWGGSALCPQIVEAAHGITGVGSVAFVDLHSVHGGKDSAPLMHWVVPIASDSTGSVGFVTTTMNAEDYVYPYIAHWSTPSDTGEICLFRLEGDEIVYLNDLRYQADTALTLRLPADSSTLVEAMLARDGGTQSPSEMFEGIDYRGGPVYAHGHMVSDMGWFLMAKMDRSEALAPTRRNAFLLTAIALSLVLTPVPFGVAYVASAEAHQAQEVYEVQLRRTNEKLSDASDAKSGFLANMSHELRTPLNSVIGFSDILLKGMAGEVNEEQRRQLEMIHSSGKRLLSLVNDVLDLSKIEAGAITFELVESDINEVCSEALEYIRLEADRKGIALWFVPCPEKCSHCGLAMLDRGKVQQILLNLLSNAVKFTDEGEIRLVVACTGEGTTRVRVSDTGHGIDEASLERIFDEFAQAQSRDETESAGTGLGLAISRRLARLVNGDLMVTSTLGSGSEFTLELPLQFADDPHG
ncbi:MAG: ATP-binding protein [Coriobacteriia bacterium]|nr:ATP-binding protein [Coriobacteriia bacterium]